LDVLNENEIKETGMGVGLLLCKT